MSSASRPSAPGSRASVVLHTGGIYRGSENAVVEKALGSRPGVLAVEANPVAQTANFVYDPSRTNVSELRRWIEECGYHCAGESVPEHLCPMEEAGEEEREPPSHGAYAAHGEMVMAPAEAMGHGGHAGMSMYAMVRDMRNRFLVALLLSIPIVLWSPIGRQVLHFTVAAPFGLRDDIFQLLLSLPVIFYSSWIFFDGAVRALRQRTLDMMVLVAVAIGSGWLYSVVVTCVAAATSSTRRQPCWLPSCCSVIGSRCGHEGERTMPSEACSTWRRHTPWSSAMES